MRPQKVPLIDAAHVTADSAEDGLPVVTNGLALCKIHHAAYDESTLGVSPDYVVHITADVLTEVDGPMRTYGLQEMDQRPLWIPRRWERSARSPSPQR